jgi:hypothetical protein
MAGQPSANPVPWQALFPDLKIPEGLTFEDVKEAAGLIQEWAADKTEGEDEYSAMPCAIRVFQLLASRTKP